MQGEEFHDALESLEHESESDLSWHLTLINRVIIIIILVQPHLYLQLCRYTRLEIQTKILWMKLRTESSSTEVNRFSKFELFKHTICPAGLKLCYMLCFILKGTKTRHTHMIRRPDENLWWNLKTHQEKYKILQEIKTWAPLTSRLPLSSEYEHCFIIIYCLYSYFSTVLHVSYSLSFVQHFITLKKLDTTEVITIKLKTNHATCISTQIFLIEDHPNENSVLWKAPCHQHLNYSSPGEKHVSSTFSFLESSEVCVCLRAWTGTLSALRDLHQFFLLRINTWFDFRFVSVSPHWLPRRIWTPVMQFEPWSVCNAQTGFLSQTTEQTGFVFLWILLTLIYYSISGS